MWRLSRIGVLFFLVRLLTHFGFCRAPTHDSFDVFTSVSMELLAMPSAFPIYSVVALAYIRRSSCGLDM
ncbi:hypothetical protein R3P38DRAFT_2891202 [Favolaschia claudopus]|uniref:Secreted protein n=1 Tax=Favolaschia claudopus TaxID=2862362 RepID=A0AAW0CU99_9AGAR